MATAGASPTDIVHYLGITPRWVDGTSVGGCSFMLHVRHAVAAIQAGQADTVLITHGESGRSGVGRGMYRGGGGGASLAGQFEGPYGGMGPTTMFTIGVLRYMKDYGLTHEQLATVAVVQREWAGRNPRASFRDPITVDDVLASRMIAYPFHKLECCLVTDGGGALDPHEGGTRARLSAGSRAHSRDRRERGNTDGQPDGGPPLLARVPRRGRRRHAHGGIAHGDVDHMMVYDAFAHLPIWGLEDLGFCGRGEAGAFIEDGNTRPGGALPLNTNGGGLSYMHSGMYGMYALQESVRQIRGTAAAQVEGDGGFALPGRRRHVRGVRVYRHGDRGYRLTRSAAERPGGMSGCVGGSSSCRRWSWSSCWRS